MRPLPSSDPSSDFSSGPSSGPARLGRITRVRLAARPDYAPEALARTVGELLDGALEDREAAGLGRLAPGDRVLVKPNLVSRRNAGLSCSEPAVVAAVCGYFLDRDAVVTVADSPAFGSAAAVARASGLAEALARRGLAVRGLGRGVSLSRSDGSRIGLGRRALEADLLVGAPRLKAHGQMRVTAGVKNLFGCVVGCRKALAHERFRSHEAFAALILDVAAALPPGLTLLDAVRAMHRDGPIGGAAIDLGWLAASADPVALDTAVYGLLGLTPAQVPLWAEALRRRLPAADPARLDYPLLGPLDLDCSGFVVPEALDAVPFRPARLILGRLRSLWQRLG
ncbi:MAG: DUF362 domain-containing protein [Desulfovibrionaceae bacterium]